MDICSRYRHQEGQIRLGPESDAEQDRQPSVAELVKLLDSKHGIRATALESRNKSRNKTTITGHNVIPSSQLDTSDHTRTEAAVHVSCYPKLSKFITEDTTNNKAKLHKHIDEHRVSAQLHKHIDEHIPNNSHMTPKTQGKLSGSSQTQIKTKENGISAPDNNELHCLRKFVKTCSSEIEVDPTSCHDPHDYWESFMKDQVGTVETLTPLDPDTSISPGCLRFVCMSDTHNLITDFNIDAFLQRVPPGDVLLHTGDFTLNGDMLEEYKEFNRILGLLPHRLKIIIPGNHEVALEPRRIRQARLIGLGEVKALSEQTNFLKSVMNNASLLIDNLVTFCGIRIYGLPWVPEYGIPGFGLPRGYKLLQKYDQIPPGIDILMSHGPALGFCDTTHRGVHVGCVELLNSVRQRIKPKYVVHGHIHEAHGVQTDGSTIFINAAACNRSYKLVHNPVVFDYPLPQPYTRKDFMKLTSEDLHIS